MSSAPLRLRRCVPLSQIPVPHFPQNNSTFTSTVTLGILVFLSLIHAEISPRSPRIDLNAEQPFERRHTRPVLAAGHVEGLGFDLPAGQIPDLIAMQADVRGKPAALDLPKNHF